jgi:hypothetical protein
MIINDNTCPYYINLVLQLGGHWRNKQIEIAILREYGVQYQSNTIAKYLSFMINDGMVQSAPTGGACYEYWLVENQQLKMAI